MPILLLAVLGLFAAASGASALSRLLGNSAVAAPALLEPGDGVLLDTPTPVFRWRTSGATQIEFEAIPDKPAASLSFIREDSGSFAVPPQDQWCCLRAGYLYRWRVRATDSPLPLTHDDPYWGPWSQQGTFTVPGLATDE